MSFSSAVLNFFSNPSRSFLSKNNRVISEINKNIEIFLEKNPLDLENNANHEQVIAALKNRFSMIRDNLSATQGSFEKYLDLVLPEVFALISIASIITLKMKPYEVQLLGGIALHKGNICEIKTGEGKTLIAAFPAILNALTGKQVHVVTVNDYLAKRDAEIIAPLYKAFGLQVGFIQSDMEYDEKKSNYMSDILYGTNSNFGFDYLRNNMVESLSDKLNNGIDELYFAIIDEVDSILIDEARTPLVISGIEESDTTMLRSIFGIIDEFSVFYEVKNKEFDELTNTEDVIVNEKDKTVRFTEKGYLSFEKKLESIGLITSSNDLYFGDGLTLIEMFYTCIKAKLLYRKNTDYLVADDKIVIVNQSTGRTEKTRRWSGGLHQAIEIKEKTPVLGDNRTMASISLQNYFKLYRKISGMSGTVVSDAEEFMDVYGLTTIAIPTNKPLKRIDNKDMFFLTENDKLNFIVSEIFERTKKNQPVLVGTSDVKESELLSRYLKQAGIRHNLLNAKNHAEEAEIISLAGKAGQVTIATNMAGRGTDIILGGNIKNTIGSGVDDKVSNLKRIWEIDNKSAIDAGGLFVISTTRSESKRIDDQLIGRSGRQGDVGESQFYVSMEDKLMRVFSPETTSLLKQMGMKEGESFQHSMLDKAIRKAQRGVEDHGKEIRKQLLKFDNVVNLQRTHVYELRDSVLSSDNLHEFKYVFESEISDIFDLYIPANSMIEFWDIDGFNRHIQNEFEIKVDLNTYVSSSKLIDETYIKEKIIEEIVINVGSLFNQINTEILKEMSLKIQIRGLDMYWMELLTAMESLRQGIHLRGYASKDPFLEYSKDSVRYFELMIKGSKSYYLSTLIRSARQTLQISKYN